MRVNAAKRCACVCVALLVAARGVLLHGQQGVRLTLAEAIEQGELANLSALEAEARVEEAQGTVQRRVAAALLPRVSAEAYANLQNRNLKAQGLSLSVLPDVVGPMSNYDVRLSAQQNVVDLASRRAMKASRLTLDASRLDEQSAKDAIVRVVAAYYLNAQSAKARAEAARSRVTDAETLRKLAVDRHDAGKATGVDVLRAEVQLANERQLLLEAENESKQTLLQLARLLGMSPATEIELAEPLQYGAVQPRSAEALIAAALAVRADALSLGSQKRALEEQLRASQARSLPRFTINANIGELGRSIGAMKTTGIVQGQVDYTLFDRDRNGEQQEIAARLKSIHAQMDDLRRGIDEEMREALLALDSATRQVDVARQGEALARRELELSQDRFEAGTTNNVEVITAQDELARAEENRIVALTRHADAKCKLAHAMGNVKQNTLALMQAVNTERN